MIRLLEALEDGLSGHVGFAGALVKGGEVHEDEAGGGGACPRKDRETRYRERVLNAGGFLGDRHELAHDFLGAVEGRGVGQLHVHHQVALILVGDEGGWDVAEADVAKVNEAAVYEQ